MIGTVTGRLGAWHRLLTKTKPTSQTHSFPLKNALTAHETGPETGALAGGEIIEGVGSMTIGMGVGVLLELVAVLIEAFDEAVAVLIVLLPEAAAMAVAALAEEELPAGPMTVVVVEVVTLPCTHLPLLKISPNFEEHLLHAAPPSLKVNAKVAASHDATQLPPFATCLVPQAAHSRPGKTPTATYTSENSSTTEEAEMVSTKSLSMLEAKLRACGAASERRLSPKSR